MLNPYPGDNSKLTRRRGKGGQHQNTTDSGVRIIHRDSGAVGESRDFRSQHQNKKAAFNRLVVSDLFKKWHRRKTAEMLGHVANIESKVAESMREENLKIEYGVV